MRDNHHFGKNDGFTGSAGNDCNKLKLKEGGRVKVTKENVVKVLQKHIDTPASLAHKHK